MTVLDSPDGTTVSMIFDVQTNQGRDYLNHPSHNSDDLAYDCDGKPITNPAVSEGEFVQIALFRIHSELTFHLQIVIRS